MIEITSVTLEECFIKLLQKTYPITISDIQRQLNISKKTVERMLQKFQIKGIIQLEPLSDKTYIRLLRHDFSFIGKKRQRKFIKHHFGRKKQKPLEPNEIMYF